jgi:uncharacterized protein DUF4154
VETVIGDAASAVRSLILHLRIPILRGCRTALARSAFAVSAFQVLSLISQAQEARPTEAQVKAAYIYNFGKFVRRSSDRGALPDSFQICILGKDPFGPVLDSTVAGETIDGKRITVHRLAGLQGVDQCGMLFIGASEEGRLAPILATALRRNVPTVSDIRNFADRGGLIGLVKQQDRIRFEVNLNAADQSHLVLSSELLKVATKVIGKQAQK